MFSLLWRCLTAERGPQFDFFSHVRSLLLKEFPKRKVEIRGLSGAVLLQRKGRKWKLFCSFVLKPVKRTHKTHKTFSPTRPRNVSDLTDWSRYSDQGSENGMKNEISLWLDVLNSLFFTQKRKRKVQIMSKTDNDDSRLRDELFGWVRRSEA